MATTKEEAGTLASTQGFPLSADVRAGLIVFLVALPLCLGIATASGAPPLSGLIAGIVGGTLVARVSGSQLTVAGPAAGLTLLVLEGITRLGFRVFLTCTVLAGLMQLVLGGLKLGRFARLVPHVVIRGMLAAVGLVLILKQLPHAFGYDADPGGDFAFQQRDGHNTFSHLFYAFQSVSRGAVLVSVCAGVALVAWRDYRGLPLSRYLPRELVSVLVGMLVTVIAMDTSFAVSIDHRINIPMLGDQAFLTTPDLSVLLRTDVWHTAFALALIASVESLLCLEAIDRVDPEGRSSSEDRELLAQGLGNATSGWLGGLPLTAVIVRSFVNVEAGGKTQRASLTHGLLLGLATLLAAPFLNYIPLAALSVVLIAVGYKLTRPRIYREIWGHGRGQFMPFVTTIVAILLTDLVTGTLLGIGFALLFLLWEQYQSGIFVTDDGNYRLIRLVASVSFLHKGKFRKAIDTATPGTQIILDGTRAHTVDADMISAIKEAEAFAQRRGLGFSIHRSSTALHSFFREEIGA